MNSKMEIDDLGTKIWRNEADELHNEDGPSIIGYDGSKAWHINGKLHRIDGPAYIRYNGYKAWAINGLLIYSFNEWLEQLVKMGFKTKDEILTMKLQGEDILE